MEVSTRRSRAIDALFARALEEDTAVRTAFVERECKGDHELRDAVLRLLAFAEQSEQPLSVGGALAGGVFAELAALDKRIEEPPAAPTTIGPYRIVSEIGRGGMAVVYLAERERGDFHQRVAIKVMQAGMAFDAVLKRFRQERTILAALNHPAIATALFTAAIRTRMASRSCTR